MYSDKLKAYLVAKPHVKNVYFDSEGRWFFVKKEGRKCVTADEIMNEKKAEPASATDTVNKKSSKPKTKE